MVVGGTGFYLRALLEGLPKLPERDEALRARLMARERARPGSLHRLLTRLERAAAERIHTRDIRRFCRFKNLRLVREGVDDLKSIPGLEWGTNVHA